VSLESMCVRAQNMVQKPAAVSNHHLISIISLLLAR
jgi:hypothetical protein